MKELKAEAEKAIDEAFNEGYKAAVKEYAPQLESLRLKNEWLAEQTRTKNINLLTIPLWTAGGAFVGFLGGWIIRGVN